MLLLCRNRVRDFAAWKKVFDAHAVSHAESGLILKKMWRSVDEPNQVFFTFEVLDQEQALAFLNAPESAEAGVQSGVVDGEFHFLTECN